MKIKLLLLTSICLASCASVKQVAPISISNGIELKYFFAEVDKNNDACISDNEWYGAGLPQSSHNMLAKNGCVTLAAMVETPAPKDIDLNGDGKLTLAEFLEFDRRGPPPGAPPLENGAKPK